MENLHFDFDPFSYALQSPEKTNSFTNSKLDSLRYSSTMDFVNENNYLFAQQLAIQALINFHDNLEEDGGFQLVPGIANHLHEWATAHHKRYGTSTFTVVHPRDLLCKMAQRITVRAGSAIFWNQMTAHGSRPNNSTNFRFAQFFRMFPINQLTFERHQKRLPLACSVAYSIPSFTPSPLGLKLFGVRDWNQPDDIDDPSAI